MSAPVDVLELLRDPHYDLRSKDDFEAAAAAVAELVEAAQAELDAEDDNGAARERLAAALARVKGGAA